MFAILVCTLSTADLPSSLQNALDQSKTEEAEKAFGVLRRFAFTDQVDERLAARTALAELDRLAGRLDRAATWVTDYQNPQTENFEWPRIQAYIEASKIQFMQGKAFEAVKRLTDAKEKSSGLAKVSVEQALSWVVEQKPDLKQALEYEKSALKTGESHFKRKKISDTAGYEPEKPGSDTWKLLKPEIESRIADLERKIKIDSYGLDYVLYSEAQEFRNASHPLAMDFTNVAAAFDQKSGEIGGRVPGADYERAVQKYNLILKHFLDNPYGQAAQLYIAVCTAKTGDPDGAINQLKGFYKEDPDGLLRGEALKLMGDLYLFAKWDKVNAREAYERSIRWIEAIDARTRVLDTYLVPEKSKEVSKPPKEVKILTKQGEIKTIPIPKSALTNRLTTKWYLDGLRVDLEWRLGFIGIVDDDWPSAMKHFDKIKEYDSVLRKANEKRYFNAYDRLKASEKQECVLATKDELRGLTDKVKRAVIWADLQFIIENNELAQSLYSKISHYGRQANNSNAYMRGKLGSVLVAREMGELGRENVETIHDWILENPKSPSCPFLLEICATYTSNEPELQQMYFEWIYTKYPNSFYAKRARYYEILHVPEPGDMAIREKMIANFKRDYPTDISYYNTLVKYQVLFAEQQEIEQRHKQENSNENEK